MTKKTRTNISKMGGRLCKICLINLRTPPKKWLSMRKIGRTDRVILKWLCRCTMTTIMGTKFSKSTVAFFRCPMLKNDYSCQSQMTRICNSMISLLTHNVAHSTRHFFRPKTNNQPIKMFLSLAFSWVSRQNLDVILENKMVQKMSIPKRVPQKSNYSMKKKIRKIRIIFDIEKWLINSEFCHFWQLLLNWVQDLKTFEGAG